MGIKDEEYRFTGYFENRVLRKRPYLKKIWCIRICNNPLKMEPQEHNRFRFWGIVPELDGRILRVVTLEDKRTIEVDAKVGLCSITRHDKS
ncbi:MAG: hypothetical protein BECKG1743D_GA0114223_105302 [Candidatus Kentron sp. G]|nr:MAG: hypothetical protein BECKG1743D_GA0114223_105302 [Candidatus Kentron sp. G]VFN07338.1 MAG: hypothetical protein BECKG1743E_GA0114224_111873 [Candidatus Kentron sp. G]